MKNGTKKLHLRGVCFMVRKIIPKEQGDFMNLFQRKNRLETNIQLTHSNMININ